MASSPSRTAALKLYSSRLSLFLIALVLFLVALTGCRTNEESTAAAKQLTKAATSLSDYYASLHTLLEETDRLYQLQAIMTPIAPYDEITRARLHDTEAEIEKRQHLAAALAETAKSYTALAGSAAPATVAASAANLQSALSDLDSSHFGMSSGNLSLMQGSVKLIVGALKTRDEKLAAAQMDQLATELAKWFAAEEPACNSIASTYASLSESIALPLVMSGQTDLSAQFAPALTPYGLTPQLTDEALKARLRDSTRAAIATKSAAIIDQQKKASAELAASLTDAASRVHAIITRQPQDSSLHAPTGKQMLGWLNTVHSITSAK